MASASKKFKSEQVADTLTEEEKERILKLIESQPEVKLINFCFFEIIFEILFY